MIHQLLTLTRPLFVVDTETTSLDSQSARVVELGFQRWEAAGMTKEWRSLVNPGVPIPAAATKVHSITDEAIIRCRVCWEVQRITQYRPGHELRQSIDGIIHEFSPAPTFPHLAANLAKGFSDCDFAGKNIRFDLRVLAAEFARVKVAWSYTGAHIIDADRLEQLGEPRTLSDLYRKHLGRAMHGAHGALADVQATAELLAAQLERYVDLPRDLAQLHALQWPGLLDADGKFKMINGVATCMFGKHRSKPMRSIPVEYYDWLISADFPADIKALASEAKLGRFPGE